MSVKEEFLTCDVWFNDQLLVDVKLLKTCSVANIVQALWNDTKFRDAALKFLEAKQEQESPGSEKVQATKCTLKSFHNLDRSILRAYVAIQFMPAWKWLEMKDFISNFENQKETVTVDDVLGGFCSKERRPILRVVPKRESEADDQEVKTIVQELLQTKSLATLAATGCPLSKGMLSLIGQDKYSCTISYDKREKFVHWLRRQDFTEDILVSKPTTADQSPAQPMTPFKIAKSRVTFEPDGELSKLISWFDDNQRPGKELIDQYTNELNKNRWSKSKRMLTPESIAVWFKNRRAKARKDVGSLPNAWGRECTNENIEKDSLSVVTSVKNDEQNGVFEGTIVAQEGNVIKIEKASVEQQTKIVEEHFDKEVSSKIQPDMNGEQTKQGLQGMGCESQPKNSTISSVSDTVEQSTGARVLISPVSNGDTGSGTQVLSDESSCQTSEHEVNYEGNSEQNSKVTEDVNLSPEDSVAERTVSTQEDNEGSSCQQGITGDMCGSMVVCKDTVGQVGTNHEDENNKRVDKGAVVLDTNSTRKRSNGEAFPNNEYKDKEMRKKQVIEIEK